MGWIVGCDTGGTFTDFFAVSETGEARVTKVSSTPPTLGAQASSRGLDEGLAIRHLPLAHERQASPAGRHRPRRSWGLATALLMAGCAAGAVVGLI